MSSLRITAGTLRGRRVAVPAGEVRPTSERARQAYFNIVGNRIEGARFLDLFAGSGIFSFEALSRGAGSATAVDRNITTIARTSAQLGIAINAIAGEVFSILKRLSGPFDLVYADPPYDYGRYDELVTAIDRVAAPDAIVAVEHRRGTSPFSKHPAARTARYGEVWITFPDRPSLPQELQ